MMSIYVMTLGELAKKRGEPVGEFVKKVNELGFEAGSHAKKLTQGDLDVIMSLLDTNSPVVKNNSTRDEQRTLNNPNVLMLKITEDKRLIALVDAKVNDDNSISIEVVSTSIENSLGDSLLEFRKQLGTNLGVN